MFKYDGSAIVPAGDIAIPELRTLRNIWVDISAPRSVPRINRFDVRWISTCRICFVSVKGLYDFEYMFVGRGIANPNLKELRGKSLSDYPDSEHATVAAWHYQEAVDERIPVCRHVRGRLCGEAYEYIRLAMPLSTTGNMVDRLVVGFHGLKLPHQFASDCA
jgi:hypothetical protein